MTRLAMAMLCVYVIIVFILSGCCKPEIIKEPVYIPCNIPNIPEKPKYMRSQVRVDEAGKVEFLSDDDVKAVILNDSMNKFHIEELRNILYNAKEPVKGGTTK